MAEVKQYINLKPAAGSPRHGRDVPVTVKINVKGQRALRLTLKPGGANLDPAKLGLPARAGLGNPGTSEVVLQTREDGSLTFQLVLSLRGGDAFGVETAQAFTGKDKKAVDSTYVVWRKLYYQLSKMKPTFVLDEAKIKGEYEKHFIELERSSEVAVPHVENLETNELAAYRTHFAGAHRPFEAHVVLIDRQCDSSRQYVNTSLNRRVSTVRFPPGTEQWPFADWLVKARWRTAASGGWQAGAAVTKHAFAGGDQGLRVDLSGITLGAAAVDPAATPVEVDVEVKTLKGEYTGDATFTPHQFIAVGKRLSETSEARRALAENSICKTVVHEIGHAIGMVPTKGHSLQYDNDNGGMGSHCRHGATPDQKSKAQGGSFTGKYAGGTCAMYHASSDHFAFCPTCADFARNKTVLFEKDMKGRGW